MRFSAPISAKHLAALFLEPEADKTVESIQKDLVTRRK